MNVNVGDDTQRPCLTQRPECSEVPAVEVNNAGVQAMRVKIVIEHEIDYAPPPFFLTPEKEGPALAGRAPSALAQRAA